MKKTLLLGLCLFPAMVWAQQVPYTVKGKIGKLNTPAKAYLRYVEAEKARVDTAAIKNGSFEFKGTLDAPQKAMLFIDAENVGMRKLSQDQVINLYLEKGAVVVTSPDSAHRAKVTGTPLNADNEKLKAAMVPSENQMKALMKEYQSATAEQRNNKEFGKQIEDRYEGITKNQNAVRADFIKKNPKSLVSLDALKTLGGYAPEYTEVEPIFKTLSADVQNSVPGKKYAESLEKLKATAIGSMAPAFTQADTSGKAVSLADFKGKYVLVDFWASWCGPCRQENPNVVENFQKFKGKNFTVLGVSLDQPTGREAWLKAIHKDNLAWTHVSDLKFWNNEVAKQYGIQSIPQNFLLDPQGKIIAKNVRGEELGKKLAEVLGTPNP